MQNQKSALGLDGNITALIGYLIWIVALVLVFIEKDNKFVRFHAFQSVFYGLSAVAIFIVLMIFSVIMAFIHLGFLVWLLSLLVWLAFFAGLILLAVKAYQGQMFKLPVIGNIAESMSSK